MKTNICGNGYEICWSGQTFDADLRHASVQFLLIWLYGPSTRRTKESLMRATVHARISDENRPSSPFASLPVHLLADENCRLRFK